MNFLISVGRTAELALFLAAAAGAGSLMLRLIRGQRLPIEVTGVKALLSITLGLGLLSYSILVIGLLGGLYAGVIWAWLVILALGGTWLGRELFWRDAARSFRKLRDAVVSLAWPYQMALLVLAGLAALYLIGALAPPLGSDDLSYHFAGPHRYLQIHRIVFIPDKYTTNIPLTMEMLWTGAMGIDSGELAQIVNWGIGLVVIGWIGVLTRLAGLSWSHAALASLLFYSITAVGEQLMSGSVELGGTLFFLAAIYLLLRWVQSDRKEWWSVVIAGVLAGFYAGTKLPNPIAVVLASVWLAWIVGRRSSLRAGLGAGTAFGCVAGAVGGIWYIKTGVMTGNPVYPFLYSSFGGPPIRADLWSGDVGAIGERWADTFTKEFPLWRAVVEPYRLVTGHLGVRGQIGPVWLAFLPLGLLFGRALPYRWNQMGALALLGLLYYLFWIAISRMIRFGLPAIALFAPAVICGVTWFARQGKIPRLAVALVIAGWIAVSAASAFRDVVPSVPVVFGAESKDEYLLKRGPSKYNFTSYDAMIFMNRELPEDAKVLLWESRGYYLDRPHLYALEFIGTMADPQRIYDPDQVVGELQKFGITHVAMLENVLRGRLKDTLEATGQLTCLYQGKTMVVCALPERL